MLHFHNAVIAKGATALFVLATVSGCGMFGTKNNGEKNQENDQGLTGEWKDGCTTLDWLGLTHEQIDLKFSAVGDFDQTTWLYNDNSCATPLTTLAQHGTYAALDANQAVSGATNINFTITSTTVTANTDDAVKILNTASYCGITGWVKGQATDVMGKTCLGTSHPSGQVVFDIYRLDNGNKQLTLGKDSLFLDKSDANSRPAALDTTRVYSRQ